MRHGLSIFLLFFTISTEAQELLRCGADEMRIQTLSANTRIADAVAKREALLASFTRSYSPVQRGGVYLIPVVFHVIHDHGAENISREQILDGLTILNNTFRKQAADTADIIPAFKPIHADCEIEFRLATKDPEGNCHGGINRIASSLTNIGNHQVKELIQWDPTSYLNIYVVSNAAGLAGHAVWPSDADTIPTWDGIVIAHNYVGSIGTSNQTQSVVLAHECGHYLNLHHIWGGNNVPGFYYLPVGQAANCMEDDQVADTPNTIGWSSCNLSGSSCGNPVDNVQNAMDYSYCNIMFTEGQKMRMHAALNSPIAGRNNLWTSANLISTGVLPEPALLCAADFGSTEPVICPHTDNTITFSNLSYHGEIDSLRWAFEGGFPPTSTVFEPTVVYSESGKYDVGLTVYANGQSAEITKENYATVLQDSSWSYPFAESFEDSPSLNGLRWFEHSTDEDNRWMLTDSAASSGLRSVRLDNWENDRITIDALYGPPVNLEDATQMKLAFKYAFTGSATPTNTTRLQVQASRNCETNWSTRLNLIGTNLETAPVQENPFVPASGQWQQAVLNIPSSYLEDGFRFRFVFTSEGNNRLYLDDINVDVTAGVENSFIDGSTIRLYPNPAKNILNIEVDLRDAGAILFSVSDVLGRTRLEFKPLSPTAAKHVYPIDLKNLHPGLYFFKMESGQRTFTQPFIVL